MSYLRAINTFYNASNFFCKESFTTTFISSFTCKFKYAYNRHEII